MNQQTNLEQALIDAANVAGKLLRENAFTYGTLNWKSKDDPVTAMDKAAERCIRNALRKASLCNFLGEEYGFEDNNAERTYIIDPIDGTKSFILRDFNTSVSIGVEEKNILTGGIVYDFMRDIMYVGFKGNSYLLHDNKKYPLKREWLLSKRRVSIDKEILLKEHFSKQGYSVTEKGGSIALAMAELAAGNYDAMISRDIGKGNSWDVAAGYYLLQCNDVVVYDRELKPFDYNNAQNGLVAVRKELQGKILEELRAYDVLRKI